MTSSQITCRKNRTNTLLKKTSQLATLCGTDALIIILENDESSQIQTHTWPQNHEEVNRILKRYQEWNNFNKHDLKRRKIEDPTVKKGFVGSTDFLGLLDSKLSLVNYKLHEIEEKKRMIEFDVQALEKRCEDCNPVTDWTLEYNQETDDSCPLDIPDILLVNSKLNEIEEEKRVIGCDARTSEKIYEESTPMTDWTLEYDQETDYSCSLDIPDILLVNSKLNEIEEEKRMIGCDARTLEKIYEESTPMTDSTLEYDQETDYSFSLDIPDYVFENAGAVCDRNL